VQIIHTFTPAEEATSRSRDMTKSGETCGKNMFSVLKALLLFSVLIFKWRLQHNGIQDVSTYAVVWEEFSELPFVTCREADGF
jgi:hypothetical protein